jgi:hypothetical protein
MTFLILIPTSWNIPTLTPEARADIHSLSGTKLKKIDKNMIAPTMIMMGISTSIVIPLSVHR